MLGKKVLTASGQEGFVLICESLVDLAGVKIGCWEQERDERWGSHIRSLNEPRLGRGEQIGCGLVARAVNNPVCTGTTVRLRQPHRLQRKQPRVYGDKCAASIAATGSN